MKDIIAKAALILAMLCFIPACTPKVDPSVPAPGKKTAAEEEKPDTPDNPDNPDTPDNPDNPDTPAPGSDEPFYPDDPDAPAAPSGPFTDLSASGTANCYIVKEPGAYRFKAVKGNGSSSVGSVAKARLLWETCNTAEAVTKNSVIESVGLDGAYITFKTPSALKPGNALIAAMDDKGTVLWSWHIWIPATDITSDTYGLSSYKMMSRNLGALVDAVAGSTAVDVRSIGLHYQWGRKDPFPAAGESGGTSFAAVAGVSMTLNGGRMTVDQTVCRPTVFADNNGDWNTTTDGDLWGDYSNAKSIYDPCPSGYKVPKREDATGIFRSDLTEAMGWEYNPEAHWFTAGDPKSVFALPGYIDYDGKIASPGSGTDIWNSHHDKDVPGKAYGQYIYEGPKSVFSAQTKARGGSVRCVSEKLEPFTNAEGMPVQGGYTRVVFPSNVEELSGICFSKDRDFIWGVGDEGAIYRISLDMNTVTTVLSTGSDLEDVTLNPNTGDLYFAKEADRVDKLTAPAYDRKTQVFYVTEAANFGNSGLEGIAYYKDDILYVGAQTGATLWAYKLDGTKIWKKQLGTIAPQIEEVGGLCYDAEKDWLWVSDSEACKLFVFNGEVTKLLAVYDVGYIGNAESVLVDRPNGLVYVGDDGSTSKIYSISFSNL